MRNQYLLIRRLATVLRSRMTTQGHLAQKVVQEGRGNCLPPHKGCTPECREARELVDLTEPFMRETRDLPKPSKPLRPVALKPRRPKPRAGQPPLFGEAV